MRRALALALICLGLVLTGPARAQDGAAELAELLQDLLSDQGRSVRIEGFEGALSAQARARLITIADAEGVWLTIGGVEIDWSRSALLRRSLEISHLRADRIEMHRRPLPGPGRLPAPEASAPFALPELPLALAIDEVTARALVLGPEVLGERIEGQFSARARLEGGEGQADLVLSRVDGREGLLQGAVSFDNATQVLTLDLALREGPGGIVTTLAGVPERPAIELALQGAGPVSDFAADLSLSSGGAARLTGGFGIGTEAETGARILTLAVAGDPTPLIPPEQRAFFGPETEISLSARLPAAGGIGLDHLRIAARQLSVAGALEIAPDGWPERIDLRVGLADPEGAAVRLPGPGQALEVAALRLDLGFDAARDQGWRIGGTLEGVRHAAGTLGRMRLEGGGRIALDRPSGTRNAADGRVVLIAEEIAMADPALAAALGSEMRGEVDLAWRAGEPLSVPRIDLRGAGIALGGAVEIDQSGPTLAIGGTILADVADLGRFSGIAGRPLGGSGRIAFGGQVAPFTGGIDGTLRVDAEDLAVGQPELDGLMAGASRLEGTLRRDDQGIEIAMLGLESEALRATVAGRLATGAADLDGFVALPDLGRLGPGYGGSAEARVAYRLGDGMATVDVAAAGRDVSIGRSAELDGLLAGDSDLVLGATRSAEGLEISRFELSTPALGAVASGRVTGAGSDFSARFDVPDLGALGPGYGGALALRARIANAEGTDRLTLEGEARDIALGTSVLDPLLRGTTTLALQAEREDGALRLESLRLAGPRFTAEASGTRQGALSRIEMAARLADLGVILPDIPGEISLRGAIDEWNGTATVNLFARGPAGLDATLQGDIATATGRVNLGLRGAANAALANVFVAPVSLQGPVAFDLNLRGAPSVSALGGEISLRGVRALNPDPAIAVGGVEGRITLDDGVAALELRGRPEGGGSVTLSGNLGLGPQRIANLSMRLDGAVLRDPNSYQTRASGTLSLTGPLFGGGTLGGRLILAESELRLARGGTVATETLLPELAHLGESAAARATRARAGIDGTAGPDPNGNGRYARVDLTIEAPQRVFLRGRGLDAELGGAVRLQGSTRAVIPSGGFNLIRGRIEVLGKRFDLTEGNLSLEGRFVPRLSLVAATRTSAGEARVEVTGTAARPEVHFRSNPELPEEEVLAQLLFGRNLSSLSPIQTAQLASAIAQLAGATSEGVVSRLRREAGLDDLDLITEDDGAAAVRAGKYLSENVYADILIGAEGRSEVTLNLDLSPALTARGRAGADGSTGLGLFFERDY
jgi:translocation and assembly module TamB